MELIFIISIMISLAIGITGSIMDPDEAICWIFFAVMIGCFDLLVITSLFIL